MRITARMGLERHAKVLCEIGVPWHSEVEQRSEQGSDGMFLRKEAVNEEGGKPIRGYRRRIIREWRKS